MSLLQVSSQLPEVTPITIALREDTSFLNLNACAEEPERKPCLLQGSRQGCPLLGTILLVDDDEGVRRVLRAFLEGYGLTVQWAQNATEALQKADTLKESLAVLVTDVVMPGMSGTGLAHILRRKHLELPVVFMSGYAAGEQVHQLFERAKVLQKPFSRAELINAICAGLETCPNPEPRKACVTSRCETATLSDAVPIKEKGCIV